MKPDEVRNLTTAEREAWLYAHDRELLALWEAARAYLDDILRLDNVNEDHLIQIIDAGATQWNLEDALDDLTQPKAG